MDKKLTKDSEIWYDNESHSDFFCLYWDNDVVQLTYKDACVLRDLLDNWIMLKMVRYS